MPTWVSISENVCIEHSNERLRGIEPLSSPWQGEVLPLNHSRSVPRAGVEPASDALQAPAVTTLAISAKEWNDWAEIQRKSYLGKERASVGFYYIRGGLKQYPVRSLPFFKNLKSVLNSLSTWAADGLIPVFFSTKSWKLDIISSRSCSWEVAIYWLYTWGQ